MKKLLFLFTFLFAIKCIAQNVWTQKADFAGTPRTNAVSFSIGSKGYVGTGVNSGGVTTKDFWEYDSSANTWTQKADFGGVARQGAFGLSILSKGYVGGGTSQNTYYKDFWEYDTLANTWTQKTDFGGGIRAYATGFTIASKGYIGTGRSNGNIFADLWEYDPTTDAWTKKATNGPNTKLAATGFSIGTKGYIGLGYDGDADSKDVWEYDPSTNAWARKADFGGTAREGAAGFTIGAKGYVGTGNNTKDFWEFDPSLNTWTQIADFGGTARAGAVGFSIGNSGYVGTGSITATNVLWRYGPTDVVPVTLTKVKAFQKDQGVQIEWTTQQENNIDKYEIERSKNGQQFSALQTVNAKDNSSVINSYNFLDPNPFSGVNFYRIKIFDKSLQVTYSQVLKINTSTGATIITIYPNPLIGNAIVLQINNLQKGSYSVSLTNKLGQQIIKKIINHPGGSATETIEPSKVFEAGTYQLRLTGEGVNIIRQVLKK